MKTIAIFNVKGGVGKSTTAYNLAIGLSRLEGRKVLLIDIDPQGHASTSLGIKTWELELYIGKVLRKEAKLKDVMIKTTEVDLIPSSLSMADDEIPISGFAGREILLRKALAGIKRNYENIIIDCPPNIGVFSINALMASDYVLVPVDMSHLGLQGVRGIERSLSLIRDSLDHPIKVGGVLPTRYDKRLKISKEFLKLLGGRFGDKLMEVIIPENVRVREAPGHHQSIFEYDPNGQGCTAYTELVREVATW